MDDYRKQFLEFIKFRNYNAALDLLTKEEANITDKCQFFEDRSMAFGLLGRYEDSIDDCDSAIAIDSNRHITWFRKGVSLYHIRRFREALQSFDMCLAKWPHFIRATELKISTLIFLGKYNEAIKLYEFSDLPSLHDYITYNNLGLAYLEIGEFQKAQNYLSWAQIYNFHSPVIYYNFCRLYYRQRNFLKSALHGLLFLLAWPTDKICVGWRYFFRVKSDESPLVEETPYFGGSGRLFASDSQQREKKAILKLLRSPNFWALCNDTFGLVAACIPYEAVEKNGIKGDIDILVSMPKQFPPTEETPYAYRGFEVKVIKVDYSGKVISPKRNPRQLNKIKQQLDKLRDFGCEQTFLLEIMVIERGFSERNTFPPKDLEKDILAKAELLKNTGHGYVIIADEPTHELSDEAGGRWYMPMNILPTSETPIKPSMSNLANAISDFQKTRTDSPTKTFQQVPVLTYCDNCKKLTFFNPVDFYHFTCSRCGIDLLK